MQYVRAALGGSQGAVVLLAGAIALFTIACAATPPPKLTANLADGARDVALDANIEITTTGAALESVELTRLDSPAPQSSWAQTPAGAMLTERLQPDARYRLSATAEVRRTDLRAPWQDNQPTKLSLQQEFSTVRAPALVGPAEPILLRRGEPLELRFSEPLAAAQATLPGLEARPQIGAGDPRVLRIDLPGLTPGQQGELLLSGIVGRNGAPAPERTVQVRTPDPVQLVSINGAQPQERVAVPLDTPVALEWNAPVATMRYRLASGEAAWRGAPSTRVELPLKLAQGQTQTIDIEDAVAEAGGWLSTPQSVQLVAPAPLKVEAFWPAQGAVGVSPDADPTLRFSEPVGDRAAAESAITFDPPVTGRFEWLAPNRVRFLPEGGFPRDTPVQMQVRGGPAGIAGSSGSYLPESLAVGFQIGKRKTIDVSLGEQKMTLYEEDEAIWSAPVATGVKGAETPLGTYQVQYKMPVARFRGVNPGGSRYDIPDVHWVLAFFEDYTIHGAYWRQVFGRPGSNGCISLTDANAKIVYDFAEVGTQVRVRS